MSLRYFNLLIVSTLVSNASVLYYQDFSTSHPVSEVNGPIADKTLINRSKGLVKHEVIRGGSLSDQSNNGYYTITVGSSEGELEDGYIFNEAGSPGFKSTDTAAFFESGPISFTYDSKVYTGKITIGASSFNVGQEYFNITSIRLMQDDSSGEISLAIAYNAFGDFMPGGTESIEVKTDFGIQGDFSRDITSSLGIFSKDSVIDQTTTTIILAPAIRQESAIIPESSSYAFIAGTIIFVFFMVGRRK